MEGGQLLQSRINQSSTFDLILIYKMQKNVSKFEFRGHGLLISPNMIIHSWALARILKYDKMEKRIWSPNGELIFKYKFTSKSALIYFQETPCYGLLYLKINFNLINTERLTVYDSCAFVSSTIFFFFVSFFSSFHNDLINSKKLHS